ncbi:hypothetical protein PROFUN_02038 [Planoprotostelium fungivorum]|uniref:GTPase Der n=1 Tax=Planoprotostelium fungivorum TaxID=1890364 RepID=A0A2P6NB74_9EUKA|nr:hypothetical protein PROFUN_02038 [Planoprotostelium fungivorum]
MAHRINPVHQAPTKMRVYSTDHPTTIGGSFGRVKGQFTKKRLRYESQTSAIEDETEPEIYHNMPVVVLVGRPNVGKSTLFNSIIDSGQKKAIVTSISGTTRDRSYGTATWLGRQFTVIDTGGLLGLNVRHQDPDVIVNHIRDQTFVALQEADVVIFMLDVHEGITTHDIEIARFLRTRIQGREEKKVVLVVNKADNVILKSEETLKQFDRLGLGSPLPLSAVHSDGVADILDRVIEDMEVRLPEGNELVLGNKGDSEEGKKVSEVQPDSIRIAIVGQPNVGKSSTMNQIIRQNRSIVSEISGTTHDPVDHFMEHEGRKITLIDTAGIRKRTIREKGIEQLITMKALATIERCHVAILLIDPVNGVSTQDQMIATHIIQHSKSVIVAVNKWDLLREVPSSREEYMKHIRAQLRFLEYVPVVFVSAKTGYHMKDILDLAVKVFDERGFKFSTKKLNDTLRRAAINHNPTVTRGKALKIKFATQVRSFPPTFSLFVNDASLVQGHYRRYLEGAIRERHEYLGTPINLVFRRNDAKEANWGARDKKGQLKRTRKKTEGENTITERVMSDNDIVFPGLPVQEEQSLTESLGDDWGLEDLNEKQMDQIMKRYNHGAADGETLEYELEEGEGEGEDDSIHDLD